jgi:uncharacterized protein (TIGR00288 family)
MWIPKCSLSISRFTLIVHTRALSSSASAALNQHVGIFVDAENISDHLKRGGADKLVELASEYGNPVVRKAYGNWALSTVSAHQEPLVANGFQLEHTPHPVAGKGAADIAMVVDVLATLHRMPNLSCFVLATGDADFGPLFRHLRQEGRMVIGVGRRSALSSIVKNTADRFVYTDEPGEADLDRSISPDEQRSAFELLTRAIRSCEWSNSDGWLNPSVVLAKMRVLDSSFDFKGAGFKSFSVFLEASNLVNFRKHTSAGQNHIVVSPRDFVESNGAIPITEEAEQEPLHNLNEIRMLRHLTQMYIKSGALVPEGEIEVDSQDVRTYRLGEPSQVAERFGIPLDVFREPMFALQMFDIGYMETASRGGVTFASYAALVRDADSGLKLVRSDVPHAELWENAVRINESREDLPVPNARDQSEASLILLRKLKQYYKLIGISRVENRILMEMHTIFVSLDLDDDFKGTRNDWVKLILAEHHLRELG